VLKTGLTTAHRAIHKTTHRNQAAGSRSMPSCQPSDSKHQLAVLLQLYIRSHHAACLLQVVFRPRFNWMRAARQIIGTTTVPTSSSPIVPLSPVSRFITVVESAANGSCHRATNSGESRQLDNTAAFTYSMGRTTASCSSPAAWYLPLAFTVSFIAWPAGRFHCRSSS